MIATSTIGPADGGSTPGGPQPATAFADGPGAYKVILRQCRGDWQDSVTAASAASGETLEEGIRDEREALRVAVDSAITTSSPGGVVCVDFQAGQAGRTACLYRVYPDGHVEPCDSLSALAAAPQVGSMIRDLLGEQQIPPRAALRGEIVACYRDLADRHPEHPAIAEIGDIATASREIWGLVNRVVRGLPG